MSAWRATRAGLAEARRHFRLVATLWLMNLALALFASLPVSRALADAIGPLPGADGLVEAFSFGVLADLEELRPGLVVGFVNAGAAAFGLGLLVGLVAAGGALEVLTSADERSFAHRFGRGGFRFFGRFLRLGAATLVAAALAAAVTAGPLAALSRYARRESGSEWLSLAAFAAAVGALGVVLLAALLAQDAARIRIVREDARRVLPALAGGARALARRPAAWLAVWALNALVLLAAFAGYLALSGSASFSRLAILVALQQGFVLTRCGLRVALVGGQIALLPPPRDPEPALVEAPAPTAPSPELQAGGVPPPEPA